MKNIQTIKLWFIAVLMMLTLVLASCAIFDPDDDDAVVAAPQAASETITGTAAAGLPIVGIVSVMGANGETASATIDTDGSYELDVSALTAPYILRAEGTVNNESIELYSTGVEAGNINIMPITNLITSKVIPNLDTDHSGLDAVLDIVEIEIDDSNNVTITNTATGTSVTGDEIFSDSEGTALVQIISETAAMNVFWTKVSTLYATSLATASQINEQIAPYVADDFMAGGRTKTDELDCWVAGNCIDTTGITITVMIKRPMEASEYGSYQKGYWLTLFFESATSSGSDTTGMVYDGTNWLWYGDQTWMDTWFKFAATKRVSVDGNITYTSDIFHNVNDETNYAYNNGIRFALLRGPGVQGDIGDGYRYQSLQTGFPNDTFDPDGTTIPDDATAAGVPENSEYVVWLYETDDYSNTQPLKEQRVTIPSKPYLPSQVTDSLFPTLTFPASNDISTLDIGGDVTLTWVNHAECEVSEAWLSWCDGGAWGGTCLEMNNSSLTGSSYTFDTSTNNLTPNWARAEIQCTDTVDRKRWMDWYMQ